MTWRAQAPRRYARAIVGMTPGESVILRRVTQNATKNSWFASENFQFAYFQENNDDTCDGISASYGFASIQDLAKLITNRSASSAVLNRSGSPSIVCEYRWPSIFQVISAPALQSLVLCCKDAYAIMSRSL